MKILLPVSRKKRLLMALAVVLPVSALVLAGAGKPAHDAGGVTVRTVVQELPLPKQGKPIMPSSYWHDEAAQVGDTLELVLRRLNVSEESVQGFLKESPINLKKLNLVGGQIVSARVDASRNLIDVQFFDDGDNGETNFVAMQRVNGKWQLRTSTADMQPMPSLRSAVITSSYNGNLSRAGVPLSVRLNLKEIFSDKIKLDELKAGDSVHVLYESLYFRGQEVATGNILAAEINTGGQSYYSYYFEHGETGGDYYDEHGNPMKKGFDGQPLEFFTRISSPFGIRVHPVLGTLRMHTGIDYAAPTGTKVLAPSEGVVTYRGWKGGYGNTVMIQHGDGMETLYGHLSAFIEGIDVGSRVSVGNIIALVGSTGRSTGPHLHYEVRINGIPVNPATVALPTPTLTPSDVVALNKYREKADQTLAAVRGLPVVVAQQD